MHKSFVLILCALVFKYCEINAQEFELAGFKFGAYPKTGIQDGFQDVKFSFQEYNTFVNLPFQFKNNKTIIINGIDYVRVKSVIHDIPNSPESGDEEVFHGISYNLYLMHDFNNWGLLVALQPTLAGDFETGINEEYFIFLGAAIAKYRINEFWNMGAGVAYSMRFGSPAVIPLVSLDYKKGKHSLFSLLPASLYYDYSLGKKDNFRLGAYFVINGGQFYMANTQAHNVPDIEKLTYSRANIGADIKYRFKGTIQFSAGFGLSNRRHYRFFDLTGSAYNFDLKKAGVIQFAMTIVPNKK